MGCADGASHFFMTSILVFKNSPRKKSDEEFLFNRLIVNRLIFQNYAKTPHFSPRLTSPPAPLRKKERGAMPSIHSCFADCCQCVGVVSTAIRGQYDL